MKNSFLILIILLFIFPLNKEEIQRKIFRQDGYDIECYVYIKDDKKLDAKRLYYWYRSQKIHQSLGQSGGNLLHDGYKKYTRDNQLVEQGIFDYGIRVGIWREWYPSGVLKRISNYRHGYRHGQEIVFSIEGNKMMEGKYSKNRKVGRWINYASEDTLYYKQDSIYESKPTTKVGHFIRGLFHKRDSTEKAKRRTEKLEKKKLDSLERADEKEKRIKKKNLRKMKSETNN